MILGHIGARKGSKGVPRKNFRLIHGKPLIDWSLDQLFAHPMVDAVVVSTDDEEIYEHAVAKGAREKASAESVTAAMVRSVMACTLWVVVVELVSLLVVYGARGG